MEIVIQESVAKAADVVADAIETLVTGNSAPVLGLATGSSPLPIYKELARRHAENGLSFANARAFLLDEYVGLPFDHPESYRRVIRTEFTSHIDIPDDAVFSPDGAAQDVAASAKAYDDSIAAAGGVDLQILGVGTNGHLAFNESGSSFGSRTRIKTLTEQTRNDNARFFEGVVDDVPLHVLTQGLGTILEAKHLVLIATGPGKAAAVAALAEGPVSAFFPASILQMHPHVTIVVDEEAAAQLTLSDYYRRSYDNKPSWQGL